MPLMESYTALAVKTQDILTANKTALGLQAIFYGDQDRIPVTPAACVEPGNKRRELNGMPRRTKVELVCYVYVYHYKLASPQEIRLNNDMLVEDIETVLHTDAQLRDVNNEPTVIDSLVTSIESGWQMKRNSLFRASRLTFEATSQVLLPSSAL